MEKKKENSFCFQITIVYVENLPRIENMKLYQDSWKDTS